ncbi:MAG: EamA family transporter [Eikenella sp.]|nr:EamA family transporter [Eikenella sp.]
MEFLLAAVACSVAVSVLLKVARRRGIQIEHAIAVNYIAAGACCWFLLKPPLHTLAQADWRALWPFLLLGVLLPAIFVVLARAVEQAGIVRTDAAQRLSLALPVAVAFLWFGEVLTLNKTAGIVLAFAALAGLLYRPEGGKKGSGGLFWLAGVWLGFGVIDILFKQLSKTGQAVSLNLFVAFALACVLMWGYVWWRGKALKAADVAGGLLLGALNFGNILFYLKAHQAYQNDPTLVFAGMNLGVIVLGTLVGAAVFKEKIATANQIGIVLALAAVASFYYLDKVLAAMGWLTA